MKNLYVLVLVLLSLPSFAQTILVLPKLAPNQDICTAMSTNQLGRDILNAVGEELKAKNYKVADFQLVLRKAEQKGNCSLRNLYQSANAKYYLLVEAVPQEEGIKKWVTLNMELYDTLSTDIQAFIAEKSPAFNTRNLPFLTKKAFEKCYPKLKDKLNGVATLADDTKKIYLSDVDVNIPITTKNKSNTYALIIGNEDYSGNQTGLNSESNVEFAVHDAEIFKQYAQKTLGIPEQNITLLTNAKALEMDGAIQKINVLAKVNKGDAELIFYYAGHGFPDETTKEPYLIPVDVSATNLKYAIKLKDVYDKLTEFPSKRVTVFLDACFSGGARNQGLMAARAVKIKPKNEMLKGNVLAFTSSSGEQSSLPYKDKYHGMFTYYLLKNWQLYKAENNYTELADYLTQQIGNQSIKVNNKEQTPQINVSTEAFEKWKDWKFFDF